MTDYVEGQTGTDNATGMRVVFSGGQWVPATDQAAPQALQPGADPDVPPGRNEADTTPPQPQPERGYFEELAHNTVAEWPSGSPVAMLGAFNPAFGGTTGVAAGLQGLSAAAGRSVPVAAAMTGAANAVGAVKGAIVDPLKMAATKAQELVSGSIVGDLAENLPLGFGAAAARGNTRIKNEKLLELASKPLPSGGAMAATPVRQHSKTFTADEVAQKLGISTDDMTPIMKARLATPANQADTLGEEIIQRQLTESEQVFARTAPQEVMDSYRKLDTAFTRKIAEDSGLAFGEALDKTAISARRDVVGKEMGSILAANNPSGFVDILPENSLAKVVNVHSVDETKEAVKVLQNYNAVKKNADGEWVDNEAFAVENMPKITAALNDIKRSGSPAVQAATDKLIKRVNDNAVEGMDDYGKELYDKARYQYRILSTLQKPGVVNPGAGVINPTSFSNDMQKGWSLNRREESELLKLADTLQIMTPKATAGTSGVRSFADDAKKAVVETAFGALTGR